MKSENLFSVTKPLIYLITDGTTTVGNFAENKKEIIRLVTIAVKANVSLIQIREKLIPARMVYEIASQVVKVAGNSATKILINDRADIAAAANADGVHLTSVSIPATVIRKSFLSDFIIGVSTHTSEKAEEAVRQGADFITFSPIFHSPDKGEAKGIERLREVCKSLHPFPVIALGGIDETNFTAVLRGGASGFAAIRFLNEAKNLRNLDELLANDRFETSQ